VSEVKEKVGDLAVRTKRVALDAIRLAQDIPESPVGRVVRYQLLKCATSVGANYRAAKRARSKNEFGAKLGIVEEEADECLFWLELLDEGRILAPAKVVPLRAEVSEVLAMVVASIRTARGKSGD
jgi:four helix bundle protein